MWESQIKNRQLKFRLAGINNQNFIMRDEETGSWWQQVSGECIHGALKGEKLKPVLHDELTFGIWKRENAGGRVLRPDEKILAEGKYESPDWERQVGKMPVNIAPELDKTLDARALVVGVALDGEAKAYPMSALEKQSPIVDRLGDRQIVVVLGADKKSVRVFDTEVDGRKLEFFIKPDAPEFQLTDAETASVWDFSGRAVGGELAGKQLTKIASLKDFWFDWKIYNPQTTVYLLGNR